MAATHPVWPDVPDDRAFRAPLPGSADVCVVGAGIAGLSVAYALARAGRKVVVVEAQHVAAGMSGFTTAHLSCVLDDRFTSVVKARGEENAKLGAQAHAAAIDFIEQAVRAEQIGCGFERLDGYLVAANDRDARWLDDEADAARTCGIDVERLDTFPLPGFRGGKCLRFPRQARFRPTAYLAGLARAIVQLGGVVKTQTRLESVEDGSPCKVVAGGQSMAAGAVVVATNSPVNDRVAIHTKQFPYMTYVVGLRVNPAAVPDALIWDTVDPYHYVRLAGQPTADGADTLIVGGEDHKTGHAHDGEERFARLAAWAREHLPAVGEVTHKWAGQVMETVDGLGFIGRNPGDSHVYVATGDSGMGMTHGSIAGILIPGLILDGEHPWKDVFAPGRKPVGGVGEFVSENADVALQYGRWLTGGDVGSVEEVRPGCGAVVRSGLSKLAVYRDEGGVLHTCSAKCPHLGGVVAWNEVEKTWDCPLHGSRFDRYGRVIEGPANADLDRAAVM